MSYEGGDMTKSLGTIEEQCGLELRDVSKVKCIKGLQRDDITTYSALSLPCPITTLLEA